MLNLDTHVLLHAVAGHLSPTESRLLRNDQWSISAIVLWEIAKLAQFAHGKARVELDDVMAVVADASTLALDGMVDAVISEIPLNADGVDWKSSLRQLALGARAVMLRHTWAPRIVETRTAPGPAALGYVNAVLGILREGGFTIAEVHHALHIFGSRLLGFTQALFDDSGDLDPATAAELESQLGATHPYVVEMALAVTHSGALGPCDDDAEFAFALDFLLDGLDRLHHG